MSEKQGMSIEDKARAYDLIVDHVARRLSLFETIVPRDEKAESTKFHRTNELEQLIKASLGLDRPEAEAATLRN